jgi:hypothetical protein
VGFLLWNPTSVGLVFFTPRSEVTVLDGAGLGAAFVTVGAGAAFFTSGAGCLAIGTFTVSGREIFEALDGVERRPESFPAAIFVWSSSRTVSFIIAPQVRQIESVGARSRLQTGQFITFQET